MPRTDARTLRPQIDSFHLRMAVELWRQDSEWLAQSDAPSADSGESMPNPENDTSPLLIPHARSARMSLAHAAIMRARAARADCHAWHIPAQSAPPLTRGADPRVQSGRAPP